MIFENFDPKEDKIFRIIDNEGAVVNIELMPEIDDETVIKAYKACFIQGQLMKWLFHISDREECIHTLRISGKRQFLLLPA